MKCIVTGGTGFIGSPLTERLLDNIEYWRQAPVWTTDTISGATEGWFKYLACSPS